MAFTIAEKFTDSATAKSWFLENMSLLAGADDHAFMQGIHELKAALPRMPRASKKVSSEERSAESYDEAKCDARVWLKGGFDAQCRCKKLDGQFLCKKHETEAEKHDGLVKNGLFNQERPTHHYNNTDDDKEIIGWHDVVIEKPAKKAKSTTSGTRKQRCCGTCGESGHDKRSCPNASTQQSSPMTIEELTALLAAATLAKEQKDSSVVPPTEQDGTLEEDTQELTTSQETGAGTGLEQETDETAPEQETVETAPEQDTDETTTDGDTESNDSTMIDCSFEGVPYTRNTDDEVMDDELDVIGEWVDGAIVFDKVGTKAHRMAKAAL